MRGQPLVMLDTNIVSGLLDPDDALHQDAVRAVGAWEARGAAFAISLITWGELRVGAIRKGSGAEKALRAFRDAALDAVLPLPEAVVDEAARIRAEDLSVRVPDALIIATAHDNKVAALLTGDRKFGRISPDLVELVRPA